MSDDFYPFVDSGEPAPDNSHIHGTREPATAPEGTQAEQAAYACRIAVYDDMLSTPRVLVIQPKDIRSYLEEITNTVYRCMREQGGNISLMVIRELVENLIHARFTEPIISILDGGETIRFADQGPGIEDKERAFEFGVTSADRDQKRFIRGTGAGFPMVQQYLENAGGAVSIEDNLGQGTVITVSIDPSRVEEISRSGSRGAAVRGTVPAPEIPMAAPYGAMPHMSEPPQPSAWPQAQAVPMAAPMWPTAPAQGYPPQGYPQANPYAPPYGAYPQPSYPQPGHQFSTYQQYPQQPAGTPYPTMPPAPVPQGVYVSERGWKILTYLEEHTSCGPTELAGAYGSSAPTWSRELDTLTKAGLIAKHGQKRTLTDMGRYWLQEQRGGM